jgi:hypothetical protein
MKKMNSDTQRKEALRLVFFYPGALLVVAVLFGALSSRGQISAHQLDLAVRGMTALIMCSFSIALLGYFRLRGCLFQRSTLAETEV